MVNLPVASAESVTETSMSICIKCHEDVWWRHKQQADSMVIAQGCRQCGEVVLESSSTCYAEVGKSQDVDLDVGKGHFQTLELRCKPWLIDVSLSGIDSKTTIGDMLHLWAQQLPCVREVR